MAIVLVGTSANPLAQRLPLKNYTTSDNLAHNGIKRIVRDSRGFLWFCTNGGLSRFDGYQFVSFRTDDGLPAGAVNDFLETRAGHFWIATDTGLIRFDPDGSPQLFASVSQSESNPLTRTIKVVREDAAGTVWIGTRNGLFRLRDPEGDDLAEPVEIGLSKNPEKREVTDVLAEADGSIWIASVAGLFRR